VITALQFAREASPVCICNVLTRNETYTTILQLTALHTCELLHDAGPKGFQELHATFACERYEHLTGHPAPVSGAQCYRGHSRSVAT